jgi:transmembrane sensor
MMDKYNHYGVEDLVWDSFFRQWVLAPTRETDIAWTSWLGENESAASKVKQAREIVLSLRVVDTKLSDEEIDKSVKQTISRINRPSPGVKTEDSHIQPLHKAVWFRIAASVALLLVAGWLAKHYVIHTKLKDYPGIAEVLMIPVQEANLIRKVNNTDSPMIVELGDKSRVVLSPKSNVQYRSRFSDSKREVFLEGEAFFEVTKDSKRPFFVYANELVTKVLGTSFTIKAFESSSVVTVEVKTGRVSVFTKSDTNIGDKIGSNELDGLVLLPNQKIVFKRDEVRMVKTLVEHPEIIVPKDEVPYFVFEDTPVSEVFNAIEKAYGIDILYDAELLKDCPLTATLDNQPLNEKLTIICKAVEATYEVLDGQILIHSRGCRN